MRKFKVTARDLKFWALGLVIGGGGGAISSITPNRYKLKQENEITTIVKNTRQILSSDISEQEKIRVADGALEQISIKFEPKELK